MKQLYFVRHGESELNRDKKWSGQTDTPLTAKGHEQAKLAGRDAKTRSLQFDLIVSSPLERALNTAQHIAAALGYPESQINTSDLLKERYFGQLEGTPHTFRVDSLYALRESSVDKYGSESLADLQKRAETALDYLHSLDQETILVVAHSSFGRSLYKAAHKNRRRFSQFKNAEIVKFL